MAQISVETVFNTLRRRMPEDEAQFALAAALEALDLPTQASYSSQQVAAIGSWIASASAEMMAQLDDYAQVRELGEALVEGVAVLNAELARPD